MGLWLLLGPYAVGTVVLVVLPAVLTFGMAFTHYDALSTPIFAGLANFRELRTDPHLPASVEASLHFVALAVPLRLLGALALALLLARRRAGTAFFRTAVYLPTLIPDVAYALIWLWILNPLHGPLNGVLAGLGLVGPEWLLQPGTARLSIVMMSTLQIGEGFVVLLAALQGIPREYLDAAAVDGATPTQTFRWLVLPLLGPWLLLLVLRDALMSLQYTFTPALVMTQGGPYYATLYLPLLVYEYAFGEFRFGTGATVMLLMFAGLAFLLGLLYLLVRRWGYSDDYS